jgi:hypothetical protein
MKTLIAIALFLTLIGSAFAKEKYPLTLTAAYTQGKTTMVHIENPYYVGDYVCDRGSENTAPTCYGPNEGYRHDSDTLVVTLEDGRHVYVDEHICAVADASDSICAMRAAMGLESRTIQLHYRLGKTVHVPAKRNFRAYDMQLVEIEKFGQTWVPVN